MRDAASAVRHVGLPRAVLVGCFAVLVTLGLLASSYGPLLPVIRDRFSVSSVETGLLVSALPAGSIVAIIGCAWLQNRVSTRLLLQASCVFLVGGLAGLALAPQWWLLMVSGTAIGLGYGGVTTLANGMIAAAYARRRATFLLNLQNGLFGVGAVLGPVCVAALPDGSGRLAWLGYAVLAVLAAVLFAAVPLGSLASPQRVLAGRAPAESGQASDAHFAKDVPPGAPLSGHLADGVRPVRSGRLAGFAVLFACFIAAEISAGAWATTHLEAVGAGASAVALATSLFYAGLAVGRLGAAVIGLRVDPGPLLVGSTILAAAMLTLTFLAPLGGAAYVLVGIAIGPVFPTGLAWVSVDQAQARHPIATVLIAGNLGGIVLPPVVGAVIGMVGAQAAPLPIAVTCVVGAVVAVLLARGTSQPRTARSLTARPAT